MSEFYYVWKASCDRTLIFGRKTYYSYHKPVQEITLATMLEF